MRAAELRLYALLHREERQAQRPIDAILRIEQAPDAGSIVIRDGF